MPSTNTLNHTYDPQYVNNEALFHINQPFVLDKGQVQDLIDQLSTGGKTVTWEYAVFIANTQHIGRMQNLYQTIYNPGIKFNYAVGKPWNLQEPQGSVGFYSQTQDTFYGSLQDAQQLCDMLNAQKPDFRSNDPYRIYKIVELSQDDINNLKF